MDIKTRDIVIRQATIRVDAEDYYNALHWLEDNGYKIVDEDMEDGVMVLEAEKGVPEKQPQEGS